MSSTLPAVHRRLFCPFALLCLSLSIIACGGREETADLPDPGEPPPPPDVSIDSVTLWKFGTAIERWYMERDLDALALATDMQTYFHRAYFPDSIDAEQQAYFDKAFADPDEYRDYSNYIWKLNTVASSLAEFETARFVSARRDSTRGTLLVFKFEDHEGKGDYVEFLVGEDSLGVPRVVDRLSYLTGHYETRFDHVFLMTDERSPLEILLNVGNMQDRVLQRIAEAQQLRGVGEPNEALEVIESVPAPFHTMQNVQVNRLLIKRDLVSDRKYREHLEEFVEQFRDRPGIDWILIELYNNADDPRLLATVDHLDSIIHDPLLNTWRGTALVRAGKIEEGVNALDSALSFDSTHITANVIRFGFAIAQEEYGLAAACIRRLDEREVRLPKLHEVMAGPELTAFTQSPEYATVDDAFARVAGTEE